MNKPELLQLLKEHLTIRVDEDYGIDSKRVRISIRFDGEEIDADTFSVGE